MISVSSVMDEATANLLQPSGQAQLRRNSIDSTRTDLEQALKQPKAELSKRSQWTMYSVIALILSIGTIGLVKYIQQSKVDGSSLRLSQPVQWRHCGNTSQEALLNGCVLDFIAGAWVPRECYDAELEEEFLQLRDWHWYADAAGKRELSIAVIRQNGGPNPMFVSIEYHWVHCAYTWKKLHRSKIRQMPIDTHIGNYEHTVHCADGLAGRSPSTDTKPVARFYRHFESCLD
jgi:hypothetical protein